MGDVIDLAERRAKNEPRKFATMKFPTIIAVGIGSDSRDPDSVIVFIEIDAKPAFAWTLEAETAKALRDALDRTLAQLEDPRVG